MALHTLLIHGPAEVEKHLVACLLAEGVVEGVPHLLSLQAARDGYTNAVIPLETWDRPGDPRQWASVHRVMYTPDRVFETLPDGLRAVQELDRNAFVVLEANADPSLRHAYPFDYCLFVMSEPANIYDVFREPQAAARALQEVMQDTAAFASEIFGLFDDADPAGCEPGDSRAGRPHHPPMSETQMGRFVGSPLGAEIASRIQLLPAYQGLVEADAVLIHTRSGRHGVMADCLARIEKLLRRIRHDARHRSVLYWGDLADQHDPTRAQLARRLRALLAP